MDTPESPRPHRLHRLINAFRAFDWKYLLVEFLIVVAGILAAFAWNSYWSQRDDLHLVQEYMVQITAELESSEADLDQKLTSMEQKVYAAAQLSRASYTTSPPTEDQLRQWMLSNMSYETPNITLATLQSMVENGDINLIPQRELKTHLSATMANVAGYEAWWKTQVTEWILPAWHDLQKFSFYSALLLELTPPDTLTAIALRDSTFMLPPDSRKQTFPIDLSSALDNPDFHDVILDTYVARRDLLNRTINIKEELSALRQEINTWLKEYPN